MSLPTRRHPVVTESNLLYVVSQWTGLTWEELHDEELEWFMLQGMHPTPVDAHRMMWACWDCPPTPARGSEPGRRGFKTPYGRGGSRRLREAVRQHLRDKHGLVRPITRVVTTPPHRDDAEADGG